MSYLALTVKQPFATLMLTPHPKHPKQAYKPLEGRMWTTAYRGPVLIHTGQQKETALFVKMREHAAAFPPDYPMGVILGMAELVACRRPNASTSTALQNDSNALFGGIYKFGPKEETLPVWMNEDQIWL